MPTYEYVCRDCGQHVEVFQQFSDEPLTVCPNCGGVLRKVFHPAGILLKGSGFYKTDNRPKKPAESTPSSKRSSSKDSSSSSSSKDSSSSSKDTSSSKSKEKSA